MTIARIRRAEFEPAGTAALCISAVTLCLAGLLAGCAAPGRPLTECPLSVDQQQQAVLQIVPRGMNRDEAARRLKSAGIEFTTSGNDSIYYLSIWNRASGERWHVNVALLFDPSGNLYETRTADATVSRVTAAEGLLRGGAVDAAPTGERPAVAESDGDGPERAAFPAQAR
jgi:hypothetical protein